MKNKEEIGQLAEEWFLNDKSLAYGEEFGFIQGYTQCQEDMADKIKKQIYDFTIDLKECTSTYVKQNCEGAIFGLNRLLNSLNKQD
jgi:hypothetical protein